MKVDVILIYLLIGNKHNYICSKNSKFKLLVCVCACACVRASARARVRARARACVRAYVSACLPVYVCVSTVSNYMFLNLPEMLVKERIVTC